jgi:SAM-dependent methyltransferase
VHRDLTPLSRRMRREWDARAVHDARFFVRQSTLSQDESSFDESGAVNVRSFVEPELPLRGIDRDPSRLRALEIGSGVGRLTRHLALLFGEVHGVDVSEEMVRLGRERLRDLDNVHLHHGNGVDLTSFPDDYFQFAFSYLVFQHIPDRAVIASYLREVGRVLEPGGLFKFQVHGGESGYREDRESTWSGVVVSESDVRRWAHLFGFRVLGLDGFGTQYAWVRLESNGRSRRAPVAGLLAKAQSVSDATRARPVRVVVPIFEERPSPPTRIVEATPEAGARLVWVDCRHEREVALATDDRHGVVLGSPDWSFEQAIRAGSEGVNEPYWAVLSENVVPGRGWLTSLVRFAEGHVEAGGVGAPLLRVRASGHVDRLAPETSSGRVFALYSGNDSDPAPGVTVLGAVLFRSNMPFFSSRLAVDENAWISVFDIEPAFYRSWLWDFVRRYRGSGQRREAEGRLRELLRVFPDDHEARRALAEILEAHEGGAVTATSGGAGPSAESHGERLAE